MKLIWKKKKKNPQTCESCYGNEGMQGPAKHHV